VCPHVRTDEEIAAQVQKGDTESFRLLVERYTPRMIRYANRFLFDGDEAKDLVQEVFIKAYRNIKSFDVRRKFSSWLYRLAHNELINILRAKKKNILPLLDLDIFFPQYLQDNKLKDEIDRKDMQKMINDCFDQLDFKYREPLTLYYFENLSYKEVSDVLQIPVPTVGIRIKRAKSIMKSIFKKLGYNF